MQTRMRSHLAANTRRTCGRLLSPTMRSDLAAAMAHSLSLSTSPPTSLSLSPLPVSYARCTLHVASSRCSHGDDMHAHSRKTREAAISEIINERLARAMRTRSFEARSVTFRPGKQDDINQRTVRSVLSIVVALVIRARARSVI